MSLDKIHTKEIGIVDWFLSVRVAAYLVFGLAQFRKSLSMPKRLILFVDRFLPMRRSLKQLHRNIPSILHFFELATPILIFSSQKCFCFSTQILQNLLALCKFQNQEMVIVDTFFFSVKLNTVLNNFPEKVNHLTIVTIILSGCLWFLP